MVHADARLGDRRLVARGGAGEDLDRSVGADRVHTHDTAAVGDQIRGADAVADLDTQAFGDAHVVGHQADATVDVADVQTTEEHEPPVGRLVGLALVHQPVAHPEPVQPTHCGIGLVDEHRRERRVVAAAGHACQIGGVLLAR